MLNPVMVYLALIPLFTIKVVSQCQPKPIRLPLHNVPISERARMRGVAVTVGSDSQELSLLVNAARNETYVYGPDGLCETEFSNKGCFTFRGGQYDPASSSTSTRIDDQGKKEGKKAEWVMDELKAEGGASIGDIAFGISQEDLDSFYKPQGSIGLGRDSSLLRTLKETGRIGANAYSLFWGLASGPKERQTNGSLLLGGVDEALTGTGTENFASTLTYDFGCSTGMLVAVNDIELNWPNGTDTSIFEDSKSTVMQACLQPDFPGLMTLPRKHWEVFLQQAGGKYPGGQESRTFGINFFTMQFAPDDVFYGDLTFSLQNSISIRIPNTQLVVPDRSVDPDTGRIVTNETVRNVVINPIQDVNEDDLPILGRLFLTSAYLSVNHDTETFSIWQAANSPEEPNMKALDTNNELVSDFCSSTEAPPPTETRSPSPPTHTTGPEKKGLSAAEIAGAVVGAVAFAAILGCLAVILLRKRMRQAVAPVPDGVTYSESKPPVPPYHSRPNRPTHPYELEPSAPRLEVPELDSRERAVPPAR